MTYTIAALYKFTPLEDIPALRRALYTEAAQHAPDICGTLLLAPEGINGTIAAPKAQLIAFIEILDQKLSVKSGELKYSNADTQPFNRFKIRPKKELITLRKPEANPNNQVGEYINPEDWNALLNDPEIIVLDTRNDYETKVGKFEGALAPDTKIFTELPAWIDEHLDPAKHKKIAMYCTGGIRCEKASSYMLAHGFENVYHLKGGILKYLETTPAEDSKWDGDCFVFDQRVAVGHGLKQSNWKVCHACREPLSAEDCERKEFEHGITCHHCHNTLTPEREHALRSRQKHYAEKYSGK